MKMKKIAITCLVAALIFGSYQFIGPELKHEIASNQIRESNIKALEALKNEDTELAIEILMNAANLALKKLQDVQKTLRSENLEDRQILLIEVLEGHYLDEAIIALSSAATLNEDQEKSASLKNKVSRLKIEKNALLYKKMQRLNKYEKLVFKNH